MAVLVFAESDNGEYKKSSFEAISYGRDLADQLSTSCIAISIGDKGPENLGQYGAHQEINVQGDIYKTFNPNTYAKTISELSSNIDGQIIVLSQTYTGKSISPLIAIKQDAALVTGIIGMANTSEGFQVKTTAFSNKAVAHVQVNQDKKILSIIPNSYQVNTYDSISEVISHDINVSQEDVNTNIVKTEKETGKIPLTEAELVISAGRGLKGAENWNLVEDLAKALGAATACSKPVSDMEWRPHSEHVGQTGITIKPNLYIAAGISGAIQHLAGVSSSKVICVINTDSEAPFFKAADYGIVGDAFDILPRLTKRINEIKG
tara:strand:+ start:702 stop:1661 length:960 start_codon:yes stop_codon:yes gene_type:complete